MQFLVVDLFADDESAHDLAPLPILDPDHRRLDHRRVRFQDGLDLSGDDVFAAPNDDVVETAMNEEEAAGVERSEVPRGKPALRIDPLGGYLRSAEPDLATCPCRPASSFLVDDRHLDAGIGRPAELRRARSAGSSEPKADR